MLAEPQQIATGLGRSVAIRRSARALSLDWIDVLAKESRHGLVGWWARFWARIDEVGECYVWRGALNENGYGVVAFGAQGMDGKYLAHRIAFVYLVEDLEEGEDLLHDCKTHNCVRHLRRGTQAENNRDMLRDGTQARGELHGKSPSSIERASRIAADYRSGLKLHALVTKYGVSSGVVYRAIRAHAARPA